MIQSLTGKLIGVEGTFINELKKDCSVNIHLREISSEEKKRKKLKQRRDYSNRRRNYYDETVINKLCAIEGTRANIDRCLKKLKNKYVFISKAQEFKIFSLPGFTRTPR